MTIRDRLREVFEDPLEKIRQNVDRILDGLEETTINDTECQESPEMLLDKLEHAKKYGYPVVIRYVLRDSKPDAVGETYTGTISEVKDGSIRLDIPDRDDLSYIKIDVNIINLVQFADEPPDEPYDIASERWEIDVNSRENWVRIIHPDGPTRFLVEDLGATDLQMDLMAAAPEIANFSRSLLKYLSDLPPGDARIRAVHLAGTLRRVGIPNVAKWHRDTTET